MKITAEESDKYTILVIEGAMANEQLKEFEIELSKSFGRKKHILIDLSKLTFIMSSGLGLILSYSIKAKKNNFNLLLYSLTDELYKLFSIIELDKRLRIFKNLDETLQFISSPKV